MQEIFRFIPIYQERVWGGNGLATSLGRTLPSGAPIGESWEIVDRPEAQSIIREGTWAGKTLRSLISEKTSEVMGPSWKPGRTFPILVKWLDCRERLSLQVHPPAEVAGELKGEPKTENWYVAEATPQASLIVGLKRGVTRPQFEQALANNTLEQCVHRFPVSAGDSILVQSGRLHAIDGGNLILEIQQNSDTTYRVYDWGRVGLDGRPRQMHVAQSLRSILWADFEPEPLRAAAVSATIADCAEFRIRRVILRAGETLTVAEREQARLLSVVSGQVSVQPVGTAGPAAAVVTLGRGDNVLLPYAGGFVALAAGDVTLLITENFSG